MECLLLQSRKYIAIFLRIFKIKSGMPSSAIEKIHCKILDKFWNWKWNAHFCNHFVFIFCFLVFGSYPLSIMATKEKKNICMHFMLVKAGDPGHFRNKCLPKISALASTYLGNAPWHAKVHTMLYTCYICIP